eukprot:TRINITY_DN13840_c0_g1_i4.p2 TRINITY_DN13840_c0_g1~~TRINITY_DN13840_c0_g1_i4.p2  ORF type:complete len:299 (-),score=42.00 TRINITY_DN13840_c0_g1_i4:23-919(-)
MISSVQLLWQLLLAKILLLPLPLPLVMVLLLHLSVRKQTKRTTLQICRAKQWTPEVAAKIQAYSKTCPTPCLKFLLESYQKAQNLPEEKIKQLKEKELQLIEQDYDAEERTRRLKISIANANKVPWNRGKKHDEETKKKITSSLKKFYNENPEMKQWLSDKMASFKHKEETKEKIRSSLQERYKESREKKELDRAKRKKEREAKLAVERKKREEEQQRRRELRGKVKPYDKSKKTDPEGYKQMMEDKRKKISEAIRRRWQDPEYRERAVQGIKAWSALKSIVRIAQVDGEVVNVPRVG